jgi:hypothetical protein
MFDLGTFDEITFDELSAFKPDAAGTLTGTDGADVAAFTGTVVVTGSLAAIDEADTAVFTSTTGGVPAQPGGGAVIPWWFYWPYPDEKKRKRKDAQAEGAVLVAYIEIIPGRAHGVRNLSAAALDDDLMQLVAAF